MKFAATVVIVALVIVGAHSSVLPWGVSPWGLQLAGPTLLTSGPSAAILSAQGLLPQGPIIQSELAPGGIATSVVGPAPGVPTLLGGPAVIAGVPSLVAGGSYVAKTRGAVHSAPLPGHLQSASSINLQPAPGTI